MDLDQQIRSVLANLDLLARAREQLHQAKVRAHDPTS